MKLSPEVAALKPGWLAAKLVLWDDSKNFAEQRPVQVFGKKKKRFLSWRKGYSAVQILTLFFTDLFDNYMQQDAHEFLNYLLNTIADILQEEKKQEKQNGKLKNGNMNEAEENNKQELTWVHEIFQGTLTNETRCLNCETVSIGIDFFLVVAH